MTLIGSPLSRLTGLVLVNGPMLPSLSNAMPAPDVAFVVQNDPRGFAALGDAGAGSGNSLGYGAPSLIANSVALEFNIYTNAASGAGIALDNDGSIGPFTSTSPVSLESGDPINVTLQYLNGLATVTLYDTVTS
ncbi:MAG TPA: hypothetical protein VG754_09235, partial [Verrucomicrobiae bacterium]|nr:hypothetical protein [Verrucomicrobiae bacterium]